MIDVQGDVDLNGNEIRGGPMLDLYEICDINTTSGSSADFDLAGGNIFDLTLTDNCTLTFSNPPATAFGGSMTIVLHQDATGGRAVTWPAAVQWAGGSPPTLTTAANAVDIITCFTTDAGTTWFGFPAGLDMS